MNGQTDSNYKKTNFFFAEGKVCNAFEHNQIKTLCSLQLYHLGTQTLEMLGIEPRAFHMRSERSTTELHPHTLDLHSKTDCYWTMKLLYLAFSVVN